MWAALVVGIAELQWLCCLDQCVKATWSESCPPTEKAAHRWFSIIICSHGPLPVISRYNPIITTWYDNRIYNDLKLVKGFHCAGQRDIIDQQTQLSGPMNSPYGWKGRSRSERHKAKGLRPGFTESDLEWDFQREEWDFSINRRSSKNKKCGHLSQIISSNSWTIGCMKGSLWLLLPAFATGDWLYDP